MNNELVLYTASSGITMVPSASDVPAMMQYNRALKPREAEKIVGSTQEKYNQVLADYAILANRYNDAKETLRDYFRTQLTILDQDEAGIASAEVAEYIKQAEQLPQAVAEAEKKAMAENEETKLNVKLKELMESTTVSEPVQE